MQKRISLIAAAAASLVALAPAAQAQSSVTLNGLVDLSVGRTQSPGGVATKGIDSGKMTTSWWGLKGTEQLDGRLKAIFAIEGFMRADAGVTGRFNGDPFWSRNAFVGLESPAGTIRLGRVTTQLFVQTLMFNAFGDSFGYSPSIRHYFLGGHNGIVGGTGGPIVSGDTVWTDSVAYNSPALGPFRASLQAAAGEGDGGRNYGASLSYGSGPVAAGLAWQRVKKGAAVADTTTWQLGGSWDIQPVKLFAQYGHVEDDTTANRSWKIAGVGATYNITPAGKAMLQFGQVRPETGLRRDTLSVGYDHFLSKRTDAYMVYMRDKVSGLGSGQNYSVGVRHRF